MGTAAKWNVTRGLSAAFLVNLFLVNARQIRIAENQFLDAIKKQKNKNKWEEKPVWRNL